MAVWLDPLLPKLNTPTWDDLQVNPIRFGKLDMVLSPNQWEFTFAPEPYVGWCGGVRSGKSIGAVSRALKHTLWIPHNLGIIGRLYKTDLEDTSQEFFNDYAKRTGMVRDMNDRETVMYCCDTQGKVLPNKPTATARFRHFDNIDHIKSQGFGWFWLEEGSEVSEKVFLRLCDRLSHAAAEGKRTGFVTANPEGRNWIWNTFYNEEAISKLALKDRLKRRGIHNRTKDNPFLSQEYVEHLLSIYPEEWVHKYMEGSFDVMEGQVHKNFSHDIHVLPEGVFPYGQPPREWKRYLGIDVGGSNNWGWEFAAVDPYGNVIFYDEMNEPGEDIEIFTGRAKSMMEGLDFQAKVIDYENKLAAYLLSKHGIHVTNARKQEKMTSVLTLGMYLKPNQRHRYPYWHPKAGEFGAPHLFIMPKCKGLINEIAQQRYRELPDGRVLNELDPRVRKDAYDSCLYVCRELPRPTDLPLEEFAGLPMKPTNKLSSIYWTEVQRQRQEEQQRRGSGVLAGALQLPRIRRRVSRQVVA